jgi:Ca-activated chloride channel homolog
MNRNFCASIPLLGVWMVLSSAYAQAPVNFRLDSELVLVPVAVTDHNGKTIQGLSAHNFTLFDDQVSQPIVSFSNDDAPCSVGVILDISGSMRNLLGAAKQIAHSFLSTANPQDEFLLLTVSTEPEAVAGFSKDIGELEKAVDVTKTGGLTSLIDTVYLGLHRMRSSRNPRRALLIVSDGMDNHSRYSKSELLRVALEADVQIYTIAFDNPAAAAGNTIPFRPALIRKPGDQSEERQGLSLMEDLANKTGGLHFRVQNPVEANEAAEKAARAIREEYVLGYQPRDSGSSGKWHRIRVKADVPHVSVYARNGYYAR